jgi:GNAT superfamily N-acetyltransferase
MIVRQATTCDALGIAKVHVDSWRTTYSGIVPQDYLDGLSYEKSGERWKKLLEQGGDRADFVAVDDVGNIIGFASASRNREGNAEYSAELHAIYLLEGHQRQGLGRQLVRAVADRLLQMGHQSMVVWVLRDNPARRFYEALGGQFLRTKILDIGGRALEEVQYGWTDVTRLFEGSRLTPGPSTEP